MPDPDPRPEKVSLAGEPVLRLANGENPYQQPADLFADPASRDPLALHRFASRGPGTPCFVNLADADALVTTLAALANAFRRNFGKVPHLAVAAKHGNACGASYDWESPARAAERALWGNPRAIWGGEVAVNFQVAEDLARLLTESARRKEALGMRQWLLDMVLAPRFSGEAVRILARRQTVKLLENPALAGPWADETGWRHRAVRGGVLRQPAAGFVLEKGGVAWVPEAPDDARFQDLVLAWGIAFTSNVGGNEVALAREGALLALGGGPSTVDAVEVALARGRGNGRDLRGAVFCADAFFPFEDAPRLLAEAGCRAGCVPEGGRRFPQVREFLREAGVVAGYLPPAIRGFCRH